MAVSRASDDHVAIVGGGIVGCATAYHLARAGWSVTLFERGSLTCGSTWHAAGLVSETQSTPVLTALARYGLDLMERLGDETGQDTGFRRNGSISLALNDARMEELRRKADYSLGCGVRAEEISLKEAQKRWPLLSIDGARGAIWFPGDGYTNPVDTAMALAQGARMNGARIRENTRVKRIVIDDARVIGVEVANGIVRAEHVVNATGMWAREFALTHGVSLPLHPVNHYYVVTDLIDGVTSDLPVLRVMDEHTYYKADAGNLLIGCSEPDATAWRPQGGIPENFSFDELPCDAEHLLPILNAAVKRVPALAHSGIRKFLNGPESFTPDGLPYLGPITDIEGLWVVAGFNSTGIQNGPGAGMAVAEWIMSGDMTMDLTDVDVRRVVNELNAPNYVADKASETLSRAYAMHWPFRQGEVARGLRRTPFHGALAEAGACFGSVNGWERPLFYGGELTDGFGFQPWFTQWREEHEVLRSDLGMIDLTFGRLIVVGDAAEEHMQFLCAANMAVATGTLVYTQMLNQQGGVEADVTVARLSSDRYLVMASAGAEPQCERWIRQQLKGTGVSVINVTASEATLALMGPRAREFLSGLMNEDLANEAFPFATFRIVHLGYASVRAQRISYVGELGWELHIPSEYAAHVLETVLHAPDPPRLCGSMAVDSCRIEKGFRHWGHDIGPFDNPVKAGLSFACDFDSTFLGKSAVETVRARSPRYHLLQFRLIDSDVLLYGGEPVLRESKVVGRLTSASYGWTVGAAVGLGYVYRPDGMALTDVESAEYEILVAGQPTGAVASLRSFHDPSNKRMRG